MGISYKNSDGTWSTLNVPINVKGEATGGSSKTIIILEGNKSISDEARALLKEAHEYACAGNDVYDKYEIHLLQGTANFTATSIRCSPSSDTTQYQYVTLGFVGHINDRFSYCSVTLDLARKQTVNVAFNGFLAESDLSEWENASNGEHWNIYNAKEVAVTASIGDYIITSHVALASYYYNTLGSCTYVNFAFPSTEADGGSTSYWYFDGYRINVNGPASFIDAAIKY